MDEFYEKIEELAKTYSKNPGEFIKILENLFKVPFDEKGYLFLDIGFALNNLSYFKLALIAWNNALEYFIYSKDRPGKLKCYTNLGIVYFNLGNFLKSIEYYEKSLEIALEINDRKGESICYGNLGSDYSNIGNFSKAIEYYEKSLEIASEIGYSKGKSSCYTNLGAVYSNLGTFSKAIEYHEKSLEITLEINDRKEESKCYGNLGVAYFNLGTFSKAIEYHKKSLEITLEINDRLGESICYENLGNVYFCLEDFSKAEEYLKKSLEIASEIGDRVGEASCCANLGISYFCLEDFSKAEEYLKKSLEIASEIGDRVVESACYANLGLAYGKMGDFSKAKKYFKKSLEIAVETGNLNTEIKDTYNLSTLYGDHLNNPELAYDYCKKSIELSEKISGKLIREDHKIGFISSISDEYQYMVTLCLKLKKKSKAFEFAERGKSRAFLDLIAATKTKPSVKETPGLLSLLDEEESYLFKLREVQTQHLKQKKIDVELGEIDNIFEKLNLIYSKIEKIDPEYVFTRRGKPLTLIKLKDALASLGKDVVLIEYFTTKDKIFIFIVSSKDKDLHTETVPISQEKLTLYIENYKREIAIYPDSYDFAESLSGLSSYLIEPILKYLNKGDLIYFVPYGLLHLLPLHALILNDEPLIKNHPVVYLPNASLLRFCQNKGSGKIESCASFGVDFENEAEKVAELFETEPYVGSMATKDKVIKASSNKDIIHFSCHGMFNNLDPLSSGVNLHDNEILTVREIFDLKLNTELVTLSACQTGINERSLGDELVGLTRAFLYAGAPSVLVSLWSVDAKSTQEFMIEFYTLLKSGTDKATALQKAQVKIMGKYSHYYYWAPFVLVGDWK